VPTPHIVARGREARTRTATLVDIKSPPYCISLETCRCGGRFFSYHFHDRSLAAPGCSTALRPSKPFSRSVLVRSELAPGVGRRAQIGQGTGLVPLTAGLCKTCNASLPSTWIGGVSTSTHCPSLPVVNLPSRQDAWAAHGQHCLCLVQDTGSRLARIAPSAFNGQRIVICRQWSFGAQAAT
jgi:hypothetical protein